MNMFGYNNLYYLIFIIIILFYPCFDQPLHTCTSRLCDDLDISNPLDIANFYSTLAGNFEGVVQYNKDNRKFEGAKLNVTIDDLCSIMVNERLGDPLARYGFVISLLLDTYSQKCTDFKYDSMINDLKKTNWNSSAAEGGRQWTYQTCTEFAYFQSSDLPSQPFGHHFPLNFSVQQCMDIFGQKFNEEFIQIAVNRTNINYGGYAMKASKTVFPNGSIDPWHALSFTETVSPDAPAIYIDGTAHCANMYPAADTDPPQLTQARQTIQKLIGQWLSE
ncbi:hypothetical protein KUTeg_011908 [Tegillarca granosa]|uniref:Serine protease K12H4.7 n=1 Tax=Tegillarca granosa TaxID=220873 RepID=A0ABQ9EY08_TEGGR|nr:hypothetical protein KUTeg_011908 [Tegillarca granosa]